MRLDIPKPRTWHLLGLVAACAGLISVMQFRWRVEDPGYDLVRRLRAFDGGERARAADELRAIRPRESRAIAPLTELLFDPDPMARKSAAGALLVLVDMSDEEAVGRIRAALASALGDSDPDARLAIARTLEADPAREIAAQASESIARIERAAEAFRSTVLPGAIAELGDVDPTTRAFAAYRLGEAGPGVAEAVPALVKNLADGDAEVRRVTAEALGKLGPRAALARSDPDERVRDAASLAHLVLSRDVAGGTTPAP